jgi:hypothetical protein
LTGATAETRHALMWQRCRSPPSVISMSTGCKIMNFNIAHSPPTEQAIEEARRSAFLQLKKLRIRMMAWYVAAAFSFPLGVFAAVLLAGASITDIPGQLFFVTTAAIIALVVYRLFKNYARAEQVEHKLDTLRPVDDSCCGLDKLAAEYPLVQEYRGAVEAQKRKMVFGEVLVIRDWLVAKHGKLPGFESA